MAAGKASRGVTGSALATAAVTASTYQELAAAAGKTVEDQAFAKAVHFHSQGKRALAEHPARDQFLEGVAASKWQRPRVKDARLFNQPKPKPVKAEKVEADA